MIFHLLPFAHLSVAMCDAPFISSYLVVADLGAAPPLFSTRNHHSPLGPWSSLHHFPKTVTSSLQDDCRLAFKPRLDAAAGTGSQRSAS